MTTAFIIIASSAVVEPEHPIENIQPVNKRLKSVRKMRDRDYHLAKKRVKAKKEFYQHLSTYVVMAIFFFLLNAVTAFGNWWFHWPILGWGIGVLFHYFDVFGLPGVGQISNDWEDKAVEEELRKIEREKRRGRKGPDRRPRTEFEEPEDRLELKELEKQKRKTRDWDESDLV